jgi:hypothetical protein
MIVRFLQDWIDSPPETGFTFAYDAGTVLDVEDELGDALIEAGYAVEAGEGE